MIRKEGDGGRRPLLTTFVGNNRQMLQEIRDSLCHLQKQQPGENRQDGAAANQIKGDLSQSTPNLINGGGKSLSRDEYNQTAMAKIRQSLDGFQISEPTDSLIHCPNGLDTEVTQVDRNMLQTLMKMGWDEVCIISSVYIEKSL